MSADPREPAGSTLFTAYTNTNQQNCTVPAFTSSAIRRLEAPGLSDVTDIDHGILAGLYDGRQNNDMGSKSETLPAKSQLKIGTKIGWMRYILRHASTLKSIVAKDDASQVYKFTCVKEFDTPSGRPIYLLEKSLSTSMVLYLLCDA